MAQAPAQTQTVNDDVLHALTRHQIYLERYKSSVNKDMQSILVAALLLMTQKVQKLPVNPSRIRIEKALADIQKINTEMSSRLYAGLKAEMDAFAKVEVQFMQSTLQGVLPAEIKPVISAPAAADITKITTQPVQGLTLKEWTQKIGTANTVKARQQIYIGMANGESTSQIVSRIEFIGSQSKKDLEAVVRTAVSHAANQAKAAVYGKNADLIKGIMWVSILDGKTSAVCRARDGKVYPVDNYPIPPAHFNCRSSIIPVFKSYRQLGYNADTATPETRDSMNGQVPADETYNSWLRQQPTSFIEDVLGKEKAKLYLDGGLSLDKFVDSTGKELTLEQLKNKT